MSGRQTLDERGFLFYNAGWQLVEERLDVDTSLIDDPQDADIDTHTQYVWGLTYPRLRGGRHR